MNSINKVLIDSSVWIEYFRKGDGKIFDIVDELLDTDRAVLCGIVEMEILQGIKKKERKLIKDLFSVLPYSDFIREDFINAGNLLNQLRTNGITIPSTDCVIGALCQRHKYQILTLDKHFDYLENVRKHQL